MQALAQPLPLLGAGFQAVSILGSGSFGVVYQASHPDFENDVAIKLTTCQPSDDLLYLQREIAIHRLLVHDHIVRCYDVIPIASTTVGMVMEWIRGRELFDYIVDEGYLDDEIARKTFAQLVSAVGYLHTHLVVHRDLKPENILLDQENNVKLTDFGFATLADRRRPLTSNPGTMAYASPEIVLNQDYSGPEVDIWSLGIILYTMVTGMLPFDASEPTVVAKMQATLYTTRLRLPPHVSKECADLIRRLITMAGSDRPLISQVAADAWLQGTSADQFQIREQTPLRREPNFGVLGRAKVLAGLDELSDRRVARIIKCDGKSPVGVLYRLLNRQRRYDRRHSRKECAQDPEKLRRWWTRRITYMFQDVDTGAEVRAESVAK